jgi:hypothetical protein
MGPRYLRIRKGCPGLGGGFSEEVRDGWSMHSVIVQRRAGMIEAVSPVVLTRSIRAVSLGGHLEVNPEGVTIESRMSLCGGRPCASNDP